MKLLAVLLIVAALILFCEGKGRRLDARMFKRMGNQKVYIAKFTVPSCSSFNFGVIDSYTTCPVTTDSVNIDYFCEGGVVYVLKDASASVTPFTAFVSGVNLNLGTVTKGTGISGNAGFFKFPAITCASEFCGSSKVATGCTPTLTADNTGIGYLYFTTGSTPDSNNPGCKTSDGSSCCASTSDYCSSCSTVNLLSASPTTSGSYQSCSTAYGNTIQITADGFINEIKFYATSKDGSPTVVGEIWDVTNGIIVGKAIFSAITTGAVNTATLSSPVIVSANKNYYVLIRVTNPDQSNNINPTNSVNIPGVSAYTSNAIVTFPNLIASSANGALPTTSSNNNPLYVDITFLPKTCK